MSSRYCSPVVDWDLGVSPTAFVPPNHNHGLVYLGGFKHTHQGRDMMVIWTLERTYIANSEHGPPIRHHLFLQAARQRSRSASAGTTYRSGGCFLLYIFRKPTMLSKLDSQGWRSISIHYTALHLSKWYKSHNVRLTATTVELVVGQVLKMYPNSKEKLFRVKKRWDVFFSTSPFD